MSKASNRYEKGLKKNMSQSTFRCTPFFGQKFGVFKVFSKGWRYSIMCSPVISIVRWPGKDMML